ncbi:Gfo/Idh/MocA family oxidoreductase [Bythopirellula goksoeyrii]|uniref:Gfo/Idh/MocA-like oxidoreductase N-terminal domain-containing protein n=1 Tax=Bythopirellula goksoeyrii TaxID=1400387 RepID=A0A5B9Q661_9BACT|nr:Gfo/Idh/MocA family oxidoreductase [Bythopirellula goksoeyrii]QEG32902.1 hypothetical protein Pr1d_01630 [Bythopirellula goksoeyrii]
MTYKRIGFVDYDLDNFHARVYLEALRGPLASRGYTVEGATALLAEPSGKWASAHDLRYFDSVEQLANEVDYFAILAPSNPELHWELCQQVFPHQKPTFVDKTFAPDEKTAQQIFRLADQYGVPVQTTSALRNTNIQLRVQGLASPVQSMFVTAGGSSFAEYGIHPMELAVSTMGPDIVALMRIGNLNHPQYVLKFSDNRTVIIDFNEAADIPFSVFLITDEGTEHVVVDTDTLFVDAASAILDFFDAGSALIDRRETMVIRRILDLAMSDQVMSRFALIASDTAKRDLLPAPHWKQSELVKVRER